MTATSMRVAGVRLYFIPVQTRVPYHFGTESMSSVVCARVAVHVRDAQGNVAVGWGETPLNVQWVWPSALSLRERTDALQAFCQRLARAWSGFAAEGHPLEIGHAFIETELPRQRAEYNQDRSADAQMPWLAALVCCSAFDLGLYDAFGQLVGRPVYETLGAEYLRRDLAAYLEPASGARTNFAGRYPADFLVSRPQRLPAWHSVGGTDPIDAAELTGREPADGYPVLLRDWIARDGLKCLKIKLRGHDAAWDYRRLVEVGRIGIERGVDWLCADYNCTASSVEYVAESLDRLMREEPRIFGMLLYVEQPFPYELQEHPLDVHTLAARKPLFMDESAHDWRMVRLGRELGWNAVALKTCKTQTGALLSLCWAKAHGMALMVQDLTNPMLAMIPHALLAARAGTVMGLETNAPQFYPDASLPEARVHPDLYRRRGGSIGLTSLDGPGFSYRISEIDRRLPAPVLSLGAS